MTDQEREALMVEIGRLIAEGNTSGRADSEEHNVAWELTINELD